MKRFILFAAPLLSGCAVEVVFPSRHLSILYPEDGFLVPEEFSIIVASYSSSPGFYYEAFGGDVLYRSAMFRASSPPFRLYVDGKECLQADTPLITLSLREGRHNISVKSGSFLFHRSHSIEVDVVRDYPYRLLEWKSNLSTDSGATFEVGSVWVGGDYSNPILYVDGEPITEVPAPFPDAWALCDSSAGMFFVTGYRFIRVHLSGRVDTFTVGDGFRGVGCFNGYALAINWSDGRVKMGNISLLPPSEVSGDEIMGMFVRDSLVLFSADGRLWMWKDGRWVGAYVPIRFSFMDCHPSAAGIAFIIVVPIPYLRLHSGCHLENPRVDVHGKVVSVDGILYEVVPYGG